MLALKSNLKRLPSHWLIFTMMITQVIALSEKGKGNRLPVDEPKANALKILAKRAFGLESCNKSDPIIRWCKIIAAACSFVFLMIAAFCPTPELPKEYCFLESNEIRIFLGIGFGLLSLGFHWLGFGVCYGWSTDHWTKDYKNRKWYYDGPIELIMFVSLCVLACIGVENDLSGLFFGIFSTFVVAKMVRNFMHTDEFTVISKRAGFWTAVGSVFHLEKEAELFNNKSKYYKHQETLGGYKWNKKKLKWEPIKMPSIEDESDNHGDDAKNGTMHPVRGSSVLRLLHAREYNLQKCAKNPTPARRKRKRRKQTRKLPPKKEAGSESIKHDGNTNRLPSYYCHDKLPADVMIVTREENILDLTQDSQDSQASVLDLARERSTDFAKKAWRFWKNLNVL